jgi:hypothetical protein
MRSDRRPGYIIVQKVEPEKDEPAHVFILQKNGFWMDLEVYVTLTDNERAPAIFDSAAEIMNLGLSVGTAARIVPIDRQAAQAAQGM